MKQFFLTCVVVAVFYVANAQNATPSYQSNPSLSFSAFRSGVNLAYVAVDDAKTAWLIEHPESPEMGAINGIMDYLVENGFEKVQWGAASNPPVNVPSLCEVMIVRPVWNFTESEFSDIGISYVSCRNDVYTFNSEKPLKVYSHTDVGAAFHKRMQMMYGYRKSKFDLDYSLMLEAEMTTMKESTLRTTMKNQGADVFEGIYESIIPNANGNKLKLGLYKRADRYELIYLDGALNYLDWNEGEIQARLIPTANHSLYKCEWKNNDKSVDVNPYISLESGMMTLIRGAQEKQVFIKTFPAAIDHVKSRGPASLSGTGFAVSDDGLFVTNYHVVKGSKQIIVRGIGPDPDKPYSAEVVLEDRENDIVFLEVTDPGFKLDGALPYSLCKQSCDVGSEVFVLGYPLPSSMGNEIKLTNGLISSRSGFQGDMSCYQISAPVQPGNSGGPVFDSNGNVIGIVNSRHAGADNASYAIKATYLDELLRLMPQRSAIPQNSQLAGKPLTEQVKKLSHFICIVEVM
jgi:hypothetical protein